jgi:glycosyltransferase involved in cell wall biosynthesis
MVLSSGETVNILFLDQSGKPGGAELCLLDIAKPYRDRCLVGLLSDGPFKTMLEQQHIPVQVLTDQPIQVRKESSWLQGISSLRQLLPLIMQVAQLSRRYDLIYANTQKALVIGALASWLSRRPLIYHLHDILSSEHFSSTNRRLAVTLANQFAARVFATSKASRDAFIAAGGRAERVAVVYNGFDLSTYQTKAANVAAIRQTLGLDGRFLVGQFSRLSPWKGQHILIEALTQCPDDVTAVLVGDALYGEQDYVNQLHAQVKTLGLQERVRFLGFRSDIVPLMQACDLIAHTSTAPEPFGRVIVEAMLCGRPVVATQAGGAVELITPDLTGWLVPPDDPTALATIITQCRNQPEQAIALANQAQEQASQRFNLNLIHQQIANLLDQTCQTPSLLPNHHLETP